MNAIKNFNGVKKMIKITHDGLNAYSIIYETKARRGEIAFIGSKEELKQEVDAIIYNYFYPLNIKPRITMGGKSWK
jgi:hypothetical protein